MAGGIGFSRRKYVGGSTLGFIGLSDTYNTTTTEILAQLFGIPRLPTWRVMGLSKYLKRCSLKPYWEASNWPYKGYPNYEQSQSLS